MKVFKRFTSHKKQKISINTKPLTVYQPVEGLVSSIKMLNDGVFSEGILGDGCAIHPTGQIIYAPFDGVISTVADTKHAIGITSHDGLECLIHVGIDTVDMNGVGFKVFVENNKSVKTGDVLMRFSRKKIEEHKHPTDIVVVLTNTIEYKKIILLNKGTSAPLKPLFEALK